MLSDGGRRTWTAVTVGTKTARGRRGQHLLRDDDNVSTSTKG